MAKRYFESDSLMNEMQTTLCRDCQFTYGDAECVNCHVTDVLGIIDAHPASDVREVRYGEWLPQSRTAGKVQADAVCSICGRDVVYKIVNGRWEFEDFCPRCGVKMKKKG